MRAAIVMLVLVAGCEWFQDKPAVVRCETVAPPVPKLRQEKIDELTDLNLDIDLAIAREDKANVDNAEYGYKGAQSIYHEALDRTPRAPNLKTLLDEVVDENDRLDKALEVAARHRHH